MKKQSFDLSLLVFSRRWHEPNDGRADDEYRPMILPSPAEIGGGVYSQPSKFGHMDVSQPIIRKQTATLLFMAA
ncbi:MAG TPA: hypothetical protein VNQ99_15640 [Xanthobacteraceae bacterium]|nr:hypothetical protein [Xanthobacteraceae bacterium]